MTNFRALEAARSRDEFAAVMAKLAEGVRARKFVVFLLHGDGYSSVAEVIHNGGPAGDEVFLAGNAQTEAMLNSMRIARPPRVFGPGALPGFEVEGFASGVAAIARGRNSACVVYLGAPVVLDDQEQLFTLTSTAQLCAVHALAGLPETKRRVSPLSEREMDCLRLVAQGLTPKQVSTRLGISVGTVRNHLERARIRCGLDSTLAVCTLAMREGWLMVPSAASS